MTDGRDSDPPPYRDLQRHLERVDEHLMKLRDDFNAERVSTAQKFSDVKEAISTRGRFPWQANVGIAAILVTVFGGGLKVYADVQEGLTTVRVELRESTGVARKALTLIEEHIATAGPVRVGIVDLKDDMHQCQERIERMDKQIAINTRELERIHERNKIADENWNRVRAKGLLVEPTGGKQ